MWVRFQNRVRAWENAAVDASVTARVRKTSRRMDYSRALRYVVPSLSPFRTQRKRTRKRLTDHPPAALSDLRDQPRAVHPIMSVQVLEREFPNDHLPLLRWLIFTGVS